MSRMVCLSELDEMSAMRSESTSLNGIFSLSRFAARRTNMITSPVGGFMLRLMSSFWTLTTSIPMRARADSSSSFEYDFCLPLTVLPVGCFTL